MDVSEFSMSQELYEPVDTLYRVIDFADYDKIVTASKLAAT